VEHEEEKRLEKEKQEKAIGLLTYLGQGSAELEGMLHFYFVLYFLSYPQLLELPFKGQVVGSLL